MVNLAALLHGSQVVSVSQTMRRWTEGAICLAWWPSSWALAHISSKVFLWDCDGIRAQGFPVYRPIPDEKKTWMTASTR